MDILRRIFGLQPGAVAAPPVADEVVTKHQEITQPLPDSATEDPDSTNILDDDDGHTRRLPEYEASTTPRSGQRITYGQMTDVGQVRNNNQDAIFSFLASPASAEEQPEFGVFVVADGMGGHHDGEKASALTSRVVTRHIVGEILLPMLQKIEPDAERPTISEILRDAVQKANQEVSLAVPEGGTTVTVATILGDLAYIGHVGDSRAYVIDKQGIEQITRDHSLVQRLIELEQLTPEEAAEHPQRNVLYRAIGQNESVDVDAVTRRLMPGARLLICSDGLWNLVTEEEIRNSVTSSATPQAACDVLVKLANERGGSDNISVILIKIPD